MGLGINSIFRLHDTVVTVTKEAQTQMPVLSRIRNEEKLLAELVLCIVSSQEKYEVALACLKILHKERALVVPKNKKEFLFIKKRINAILSQPFRLRLNGKLQSRRLRFSNKKADYIVSTMENIYLRGTTLSQIIRGQGEVKAIRMEIIKYGKGIGPKQASMFLRNIGYSSDLAILDKHIFDFMWVMGLTNSSRSSVSTISEYERLEDCLLNYAHQYSLPIFYLDIAIWTTMRTIKASA